MSGITKEKVRLLFEDDRPIEFIIKNFNEKSHYQTYAKPTIAHYHPFDMVCTCTCELILARSHFLSSVLLYSLKCIGEIEIHRLGDNSSPRLINLTNSFKRTVLRDELLYVSKVENTEQRILDQVGFEINNLLATEKLISRPKSDRHLHPYIMYWYLVKKLRIDIKVASRYHSTQGIIRLCMLYLQYYRTGEVDLTVGYSKILKLYDSLAKEIIEEKNEFGEKNKFVDVLPIGVNYELGCGRLFLEYFLEEYTKRTFQKNSDDLFLDYTRLNNFSIYVLRLLNDYQSKEVNNEMGNILELFNSYLVDYKQRMNNTPETKEYYNYWIENCRTIDPFYNLSFLRSYRPIYTRVIDP